MSKKDYVLYGHPVEIIEDEDNAGVNKRAKKPHEEIVTDEKGRQRFHGAFTGGFSAGYFNTVGSKHGWVPTSFTSTKNKRTNFEGQKREDFMDDEDLSEFGIVSSRLKLKSDYDPINKDKRQPKFVANSLEFHLEGMLSLKNDINMGVNILKSMGWKFGQGIGEKLSRKNLEKMRVLERQKNGFDIEKVKEFDKFAPEFKFAPDDVTFPNVDIKKNRQGIGYKGLASNHLSSFGSEKKITSQISGNNVVFKGYAFGVGAFEQEDEDIYGMPDMSEYDFELTSKNDKKQNFSSNDAEFIKIEDTQKPRKSYYSDKVPCDFDCKHKPFKFDYNLLPDNILRLKNEMSFDEKKIVFAEDEYKMNNSLHKNLEKRKFTEAKDTLVNCYPNNPMKTYRYNQFVNYTKKGILFPMPVGMSKSEYEEEINEFKQLLPSEMLDKYERLKQGAKPLAQYDYIEKIKEMVSNKFVKAGGAETDVSEFDTQKNSILPAREIVRTVQEWHPSHVLCKLFNVKDPFPGSDIIGLLFNPNNFKYDSKDEWKKIKDNVSNVKSTVEFECPLETNEQILETHTNNIMDEELLKVKKDILLAIFDNIEKDDIQDNVEKESENFTSSFPSKSNVSNPETDERVSTKPTVLYNDKNNISEILKGYQKIKDGKDYSMKKEDKRKTNKSKSKDNISYEKHHSRRSRSTSREKTKHRKRERKKHRHSKSSDSAKYDKKSKKKKKRRSSSSNSSSDEILSRVVNDYLDKLIK
uniref:G-patch domain-containing protein n=1 Tax=Strongyloides venezuelensis TaxID=75913 RepID=A0A0K0F7D5_STRVS